MLKKLNIEIDALLKLTPCRMHIIAEIQLMEHYNIRSIAQWLSRDYKNVHGDVKFLEAAGIIKHNGKKWDICAQKLVCII